MRKIINKLILLLALIITNNAWSDSIAIDGQCDVNVTNSLKYFNTLGTKKAAINNQVIYFNHVGVNGSNNLVNTVTNETGAIASIFMKIDHVDNDVVDFIQVSTNLSYLDKKFSEVPSNVTGTTFNPKGAAYASLSLGRQYCGIVSIFGRNFETGYQPIFVKDQEKKEVIGALFVGYPLN